MSDSEGARYRLPDDPQVEFQPGSGGKVMSNKLGITDPRVMDRAEYDAFLNTQRRYLSIIHTDTRFTADLLRRMHRDWLGEIYAWAGEYRVVNLTKGDFTWPPAIRVPDNMAAFDAGILREHTPCPAGSVREVATRLAIVHAEFLLIHPFREGNGRLSRWLADLMSTQAGFSPPAYQWSGPNAKQLGDEYIRAVQMGYMQDYSLLVDFFDECLERGLSEGG